MRSFGKREQETQNRESPWNWPWPNVKWSLSNARTRRKEKKVNSRNDVSVSLNRVRKEIHVILLTVALILSRLSLAKNFTSNKPVRASRVGGALVARAAALLCLVFSPVKVKRGGGGMKRTHKTAAVRTTRFSIPTVRNLSPRRYICMSKKRSIFPPLEYSYASTEPSTHTEKRTGGRTSWTHAGAAPNVREISFFQFCNFNEYLG